MKGERHEGLCFASRGISPVPEMSYLILTIPLLGARGLMGMAKDTLQALCCGVESSTEAVLEGKPGDGQRG